ncbi:MAG TPA: hypothetical protein DCS93_14305 [Microscillaceae bacterium]|nr:hypothetical protein [Microscillaceae bacterium]
MTKLTVSKAFNQKPLVAFLCVFFFVQSLAIQAKPVPQNWKIGNIKLKLSYQARLKIKKEARYIQSTPFFRTNKVRLASLHLPLVAQELRPHKVPDIFKYLALVNNPSRDSIKFWNDAQRMAPMLGLRMNAVLDETLNIVMTSEAMAKFFRKRYLNKYNWVASLLSYAMSAYHINNFLKKHYQYKTKTLKLDKDIPHFLLNFLATVEAYRPAIEQKKRYSVTLIKYDLVNNKSFARIGQEFSIPSSTIQRYNAWFRGQVIPQGRKYYVVIPMPTFSPSRNIEVATTPRKTNKGITRRRLSSRTTSYKKAKNYAAAPGNSRKTHHLVSRGETLYSIARLYGVSVFALKKWNALPDNRLNAGQKLRVQVQSSSRIAAQSSKLRLVAAANRSVTKKRTVRYAGGTSINKSNYKKLRKYQPRRKPRAAVTHLVKSGENLYRISRKYNMSVARIKSLNQMRDDRVFVGKRLIIRPAVAGSIDNARDLQMHTTWVNHSSKAATNSPNVPATMYVAGMKLRLTAYAQRLIQHDINQLTAQPRFFKQKLARIKEYMPIIKRILGKESIPGDFRFLPILESSMIANAVSTSNAVGYWQFKKDAALEVGMQIDEKVDERLNIVAATAGATRYLNRNHLFFQNWLHTLLSYNLGFAGTKVYLEDRYMSYTPTAAREMTIDGNTHWYIRRFLAHKLAFEKPLNSYIRTSHRLTHFNNSQKTTLQQIAQRKGVNVQLLRKYNQWLKIWQIPDEKSYPVIVPLKN